MTDFSHTKALLIALSISSPSKVCTKEGTLKVTEFQASVSVGSEVDSKDILVTFAGFPF